MVLLPVAESYPHKKKSWHQERAPMRKNVATCDIWSDGMVAVWSEALTITGDG
jgi:hypothetical protein